jgi:hypothetical protein
MPFFAKMEEQSLCHNLTTNSNKKYCLKSFNYRKNTLDRTFRTELKMGGQMSQNGIYNLKYDTIIDVYTLSASLE